MKTTYAAMIADLAKTLRADGIDTDALAFEVTKMEAETTEEGDEDGTYTSTSYTGTCTVTLSGCIKAVLNIVDDAVDCELTEKTEVMAEADDDLVDDLNDWIADYNPAALAEYLTIRFADEIRDAMDAALEAEADAAEYARDPYAYYGVSRRDFY